MYTLKALPEDFVVNESKPEKLLNEGRFAVFSLQKKNWSTIEALIAISSYSRINIKEFGYCGVKDKHALTTQYISVNKIHKKRLSNVKIQDIILIHVGYTDSHLHLGSHDFNEFKITIRNLPANMRTRPITYFPNYFDDQRFGKHNDKIGKSLLKGDYSTACGLIDAPEVREYLKSYPKDYVGALSKINKKKVLLYVHAFQSLLFNSALKNYIKKKYKNNTYQVRHKVNTLLFPNEINREDETLQMPIIGFSYDTKKDLIDEIYTKILQTQGITLRDFIIKKIPHLSAEGGIRRAFVRVEKPKIGVLSADELNPTKKKLDIQFRLPSGSYATMAIKGILAKSLIKKVP